MIAMYTPGTRIEFDSFGTQGRIQGVITTVDQPDPEWLAQQDDPTDPALNFVAYAIDLGTHVIHLDQRVLDMGDTEIVPSQQADSN